VSSLTAPIYSFKSGILSRKLLARRDLKILESGILQGENFVTLVQGSQEFRPGFKFIKLTRMNLPAQFWSFVFNDDQSFILEFTDYKLRFYSQEGVISEAAKTITGMTNANPGVFTSVAHGYATDDEIFITGLVGVTGINGQYYRVVRLTADTYSLKDIDGTAINTTSLGTRTSGGTSQRVYEISTPYTKVQAESIKLAGNADVRYLVDGTHMPRKLTRLSNTSWTLTSFVRTNDPFEQGVITAITQANPASVTAVAHGRATGEVVFLEDITGMVELNNRSFTITRVSADVFTLDGEDSTGYTAYASGGICSLVGSAPRAVGLYGAALFYGGADNDPDVFDMSRHPDPTTGEPRYDDFTLGSDPEDAVRLPISPIGESVARIRWFAGTRSFLGTGTFGGMAKINGGANEVPVTNVNINAPAVDAYGVSDVTPVVYGTDIIYLNRDGRSVMSFVFTLQNDGFESFDTMLQSDELSIEGVSQMAYQQGTPALVWALLDDGSLLSLTYKRAEAVTAWNTHSVARAEVTTISSERQSDQKDRLWIVAKRTVNSIIRYMVEVSADNPDIPERKKFRSGVTAAAKLVDQQAYLDNMWEAQRRSIHLDSALVMDTTQTTTLTPAAVTGDEIVFTAGSSIFVAGDVGRQFRMRYLVGGEVGIAQITEYVSATQVKANILQDFASTAAIPSGAWYFTKGSISGLNHLEGEVVRVVEDGGAGSDKTVTAGSITFDDQCAYAVIGLGYIGVVETMPIELLLSVGITTGKFKSSGRAKILFRNTLGAGCGIDVYDIKPIKFRTGNDIGGRPAPLFSGYQDLPAFDGYDILKTYQVFQTQPFPCTVQSLVLDLEAVV